MNETLLAAKDVAAILRVTEWQVYTMARLPKDHPNRLPCIRFGGRVRFDPDELRRWLEARRQ